MTRQVNAALRSNGSNWAAIRLFAIGVAHPESCLTVSRLLAPGISVTGFARKGKFVLVKPISVQAMVRALCALALVFAAFAHRPLQFTDSAGFNVAAYTLPDGTVPVICQFGSEANGSKPDSVGGCEFCRLSASVVLPDAPAVFVSCAIDIDLAFDLPANDDVIRQAFSANAPPRGPPPPYRII